MQVCSDKYSYACTQNFTGYRTVLGKKLDSVLKSGVISDEDNRFLVTEIKKLVEKRLKEPDNLGEGMQNRVYKLDDKYVIRVPINVFARTDNKITITNQKFDTLKTYYGEPVFQTGNIKILKNAYSKGKAIPAGVPKNLPDGYSKSDITGYYSNFYLPTFAKLPQKSYDALARDIKNLRQMQSSDNTHYCFDYFNPNNVVLSGKSLKMTDEIEETSYNDKNSIVNMLNLFIKQMTVGIPATPSTKLAPLRQEIAKKIIKAGMKYDLPISCYNPESGPWHFTLKYLCNAQEEPKVIFDKLSRIKNTSKSQKEVEKMTDEYLSELFP